MTSYHATYVADNLSSHAYVFSSCYVVLLLLCFIIQAVLLLAQLRGDQLQLSHGGADGLHYAENPRSEIGGGTNYAVSKHA